MSFRYVVYKTKWEVERADSEGRITSLKEELVLIANKAELKSLLKESPENIFLKPIPNISGEIPYQGLLVDAPREKRIVVEGRKTSPPPRNPLEMMMQSSFGRELKTFDAVLKWSERSKKWIVAS